MAVGTTYTSTITRDQLISDAYVTIGVLAPGDALASELSVVAIRRLNAIVRELDAAGKWLWAQTSSSLTLVANTWVYTTSNGLPSDVRDLLKVLYRDANASDFPVDILTAEGYADVSGKTDIGAPSKVYLTESNTLGSHTLYVWPALDTVNTQSVVTGTDAAAYKCTRSHTSDSTNHPITGANYLQYWTAGGSGPSAWATATSYTSPQQLLFWYRRPLADFTAASDNPDMPSQYGRLLMYRLAEDLADIHRLPEDGAKCAAKARAAYQDVFQMLRPTTTDIHGKASYF